MKIGISTLYYKSTNYGGLLQAYALCKKINNLGYDAEQICFSVDTRHINSEKENDNLGKIVLNAKIKIYNIYDKFKNRELHTYTDARSKKTLKFAKTRIPHSKKIYTEKDLDELNNKYDCFVVGSDMVWKPNWYNPAYSLEFVSKSKSKFSYAASIGASNLSEDERCAFKSFLSDYQGVSVREKSAVQLLDGISQTEVEQVLDPTLILTADEWNEIVPNRIIDEDYVFCYFLGDNTSSRDLATKYAKKHNLKVVTIPYLLNSKRECDDDFGDYKLSNVDPIDFVSLIKNSNCVFTDSFHACAFSSVYRRNVFAFRRNANDTLGVRVKDFLSLVGLSSHYCGTADMENLEHIERVAHSSELYNDLELATLRTKSLDYLRRNLEMAKSKQSIN